MNEIYLYTGCLIPTRLPHLERASTFVLDALGVDYERMPGQTCCVEPIGLRSLGVEAWMVGAARILAMAERDGRDLLTLCNGCYMSLSQARMLLMDLDERARVNRVLEPIDLEYGGDVNVWNVAEFVHAMGKRKFKDTVRSPQRRQVALHPGCHMTEAPIMDGFDALSILEDILTWCGAEVVCWGEGMCCGGGLSGVDDRISKAVMDATLTTYRDSGAGTVITPCPFCFIQFDVRGRSLPALFLTQLMALALGADEEAIGLRYHRTR